MNDQVSDLHYICVEELIETAHEKCKSGVISTQFFRRLESILRDLKHTDVEPVVRCEKCRHGIPFDRNSEMDESMYMNCAIGRGEEIRNVWHKYKKYYKDYSVVDRDGFCDQGEAGELDVERSGSGDE